MSHSQPAGKQEASTSRIPAQNEELSKTKSKTQSEMEAVFHKLERGGGESGAQCRRPAPASGQRGVSLRQPVLRSRRQEKAGTRTGNAPAQVERERFHTGGADVPLRAP